MNNNGGAEDTVLIVFTVVVVLVLVMLIVNVMSDREKASCKEFENMSIRAVPARCLTYFFDRAPDFGKQPW